MYRQVKFQNKEDAEKVLEEMQRILKLYGRIFVGDMKDLCGMEKTFEDDRTGWVDLININIVEKSGGFVIDLPSPRKIES